MPPIPRSRFSSWSPSAGSPCPAIVLWTLIVVGGLGAYVAWELDFVPVDRAAAVVILTVATYPFLFAFDRGNIEAFVTLLLAAFVWAIQTG